MNRLPLSNKLKAGPQTFDIHIVAVTSCPERVPKGKFSWQVVRLVFGTA
jgi:hypothetical protein